MKKLRIAVFTASRSEYGLLRPLLKLLAADDACELLLLVGGAHLSQRFGYTKSEIEADGFPIAAEFNFLAEPPEEDYLTKSLARLQEQIGEWLYQQRPDWLIVLGDRFELLAVANAALLYKIPLAHISGGDVTEGAIDNQIRHAVSKLAHAHFPATAQAHQVLLSLGEEDWRICLCGEPGLDQILSMNFISKDELFAPLKLQKNLQTILMTFHPDTLTGSVTPDFITELCAKILENPDYQILATGSNFDEGGDAINAALREIAEANPRFHFAMSLGQLRYYSMLKHSALLLGNSSSGVVETQSFRLPAINVGTRQLGRTSNPNVMHVPADITAISAAIPKALSAEFKSGFAGKPNIYGDGQASPRIVAFLKGATREKLLAKR